MYLQSGSFDTPSNGIKHNSSVYDWHLRRGLRCMKSANSRTDSGRLLAGVKWLGHIGVRTCLQRLNLVIFTIADGQHENRYPCVASPDPPTGFNSANSW